MRAWLYHQTNVAWILVPLLPSCVTMGKLFNLSELPLHHCKMGENNSPLRLSLDNH